MFIFYNTLLRVYERLESYISWFYDINIFVEPSTADVSKKGNAKGIIQLIVFKIFSSVYPML